MNYFTHQLTICLSTFRLTTVELIRQQEGPKSSVRLQVAAVSCDECGAIPWDELQVDFIEGLPFLLLESFQLFVFHFFLCSICKYENGH